MGFVRDESGELMQAADPKQMPTEQDALDAVRAMARSDYDGVIAWKRATQYAGATRRFFISSARFQF
ncbi:MAG: hypothetical protein CMF04_15785 [Hyphomonas sp.]|nr:hypothetical protein [Hyphomonas sp.]